MRLLPVAALALSASLAAQETIRVHVVEVPVTVVDKSGNPIRNLKASDFRLFEDGKEQAITSFDAIDFASEDSLSASAITPGNPNSRRTFMILFDLGYYNPKGLERARVAARDFVASSVLPRDLVAVGSVDPYKGFRLLTGFTTDRNAVGAAIDRPAEFRGTDPLQLSDADPFGSGVNAAESAGSADANSSTGGRAAMATDESADVKDLIHRDARAYAVSKVTREVDLLAGLANTLRSVRGRKQVILISSGFEAALVRGRAGHGALRADMNDMQKAVSGQAYLINNDARFGDTKAQSILDEMAGYFKQSDVVLHAIDVRGVSEDESASISNDGLHLLAEPTGGTVFENSNSFRDDFNRMLKQQEVVYVLAYQAHSNRKKMHDLSVKVNVPGASVHNRIAYYDDSGETVIERELSNAEVIMNDIAQPDIRIAALPIAPPQPSAATRAAVPLFLEINGSDLLRGATKPIPADIYVYAFDDKGTVRDRLYQRIAIDPSRASENLKTNGVKYFATLALPQGRYAIKSLIVVPDTKRRGFVRSELTVGAANTSTVLPPLFIEHDQWAVIKGPQHDASSSYALQLNGEPFVPSAVPHLRKSQPNEFALFLYNADAEDMLLQASIVDAAGATHAVTPNLSRQLKGEGVTKLVFTYEPNDVPAGPATLTVSVRKKDSPAAQKTSLPVTVD